MIENRISAVMPQEDLNPILGAVTEIKTRMSFLTNASPDERKRMARAGDRSHGFIARALEVATQNPEILPRMFNLEEMRKDVELLHQIQQIQLSLNHLMELIDSTKAITQNESYLAALAVYGFAKAGGKVVALQEAKVDLGKQFSQRGAAPAKPSLSNNPANQPSSTTQSNSNQ